MSVIVQDWLLSSEDLIPGNSLPWRVSNIFSISLSSLLQTISEKDVRVSGRVFNNSPSSLFWPIFDKVSWRVFSELLIKGCNGNHVKAGLGANSRLSILWGRCRKVMWSDEACGQPASCREIAPRPGGCPFTGNFLGGTWTKLLA